MQFKDLTRQYNTLKTEINRGIEDVITSSDFILGKPVWDFENLLAEYVGRKHCIGVGSGTDALVLALRAYDIGPGDAVFVPDFTYIASASCVALVGATPVFVDIDPDTFNICPVSLKERIESIKKSGELEPKVIISVDLFGLPADYGAISEIAKQYKLIVIEDAAQGFGGKIAGKAACSFGDISTTSFFPAKPLGSYGDGGAVFTDDDIIDRRIRSLRAGGKSDYDKYDNIEIGYNSRLDTIQAAVLIPKLNAFKEFELDAINRIAERYTKRLNGNVITPYVPEGFFSSWAQYTIRFKCINEREHIKKRLKENNIPSMIYYPRGLHQQKAFVNRNLHDDMFKNTVAATKTVLSLPIHPYLQEDEVDLITSVVLGE